MNRHTRENGTPLTRDIGVRLSLTQPAELPLDLVFEEGTPEDPPNEITINNGADCEVSVALKIIEIPIIQM
ncbi:hypothetical protein CKO38_00780 [Rhodospirillum rubrum]|uniref:hypothetical protein n=1 Tax=Rhodospirillum rubrum TaxID=1085 RepID=UPI001905AFFA|nr:hypothetical protein [Rhodospirillum rubrum]MBK1662942.1 hypothetical protein [Rhodospirillum rubrum]MBK1675229.1 hypothetical protein [Rhodospirillum rubrum]